MIRYSSNHSWLRSDESEIITVGITKYIIKMLGNIVHIHSPKVALQCKSGEEIFALEATKSISDIEAPLSGEIIAINTQLIENPELVNSDPEGEGWIYRIKSHNPDELKSLLDAEQYSEFCR